MGSGRLVRVEDRIRTAKGHRVSAGSRPGVRDQPAWLELALIGIDLLAWTRTLLLDGEHALAEPKKRLADCCTSPPASCTPPDEPTAYRPTMALGPDLTTAFTRLDALPDPDLNPLSRRYKGHGEHRPTSRSATVRAGKRSLRQPSRRSSRGRRTPWNQRG